MKKQDNYNKENKEVQEKKSNHSSVLGSLWAAFTCHNYKNNEYWSVQSFNVIALEGCRDKKVIFGDEGIGNKTKSSSPIREPTDNT